MGPPSPQKCLDDDDDDDDDVDDDDDDDDVDDGDGDGKYHHSFYLVMWLYDRRVQLSGFFDYISCVSN